MRARFDAEGVTLFCVTLAADPEAILSPDRNRVSAQQSANELPEMIAQGYARRPFSEFIVSTSEASFEETALSLTDACSRLIVRLQA